MDKYRIQDDAIALFDGGWRSCDAEELQSGYGFNDNELAEISEKFFEKVLDKTEKV